MIILIYIRDTSEVLMLRFRRTILTLVVAADVWIPIAYGGSATQSTDSRAHALAGAHNAVDAVIPKYLADGVLEPAPSDARFELDRARKAAADMLNSLPEFRHPKPGAAPFMAGSAVPLIELTPKDILKGSPSGAEFVTSLLSAPQQAVVPVVTESSQETRYVMTAARLSDRWTAGEPHVRPSLAKIFDTAATQPAKTPKGFVEVTSFNQLFEVVGDASDLRLKPLREGSKYGFVLNEPLPAAEVFEKLKSASAEAVEASATEHPKPR